MPVLNVLVRQETKPLSVLKTVHVAMLMVSNAPNATTKSTPSVAHSASGPTTVFAAKHAAAVDKNVIDVSTGPTVIPTAKLTSANATPMTVLHQNTTNAHAIKTLPTWTTSKADSAASMTLTTAKNVKLAAMVAVPANPTYSESAVLPAARVPELLLLFLNGPTATKAAATTSKNATPRSTVRDGENGKIGINAALIVDQSVMQIIQLRADTDAGPLPPVKTAQTSTNNLKTATSRNAANHAYGKNGHLGRVAHLSATKVSSHAVVKAQLLAPNQSEKVSTVATKSPPCPTVPAASTNSTDAHRSTKSCATIFDTVLS